jgi:hypothetical protein
MGGREGERAGTAYELALREFSDIVFTLRALDLPPAHAHPICAPIYFRPDRFQADLSGEL